MSQCAVCGKPAYHLIFMGGVMLCSPCSEDVRVEIDAARAAGKPVVVSGIARRMYREAHHADGSYTIKDIPAELWDRAKHRALDEDTSVRELILTALEKYIAG